MKKLLAVVGIAGLAVGGWKIHSHKAVATDGGKLVADRVWIDHMPRSERDTVNVFIVLSSDPFGVFQASSRWQGQFEMFMYEQKGNEIRAVFPQTDTKETIKATAKKCDQKGFDFCLELGGGKHGVARYYSMEGWDVGSADAAHARIDQIQGR
jgi:hypothetical protein